MYDPEAIYQDADIEMAEATAAANETHTCNHDPINMFGDLLGPPCGKPAYGRVEMNGRMQYVCDDHAGFYLR